MHVRLDAGLPVSLHAPTFRRHLEWQAVTESHLPPGFRGEDYPNLAVETAAIDVRFCASVLLDRLDRNHSCVGAHPEAALVEIDQALASTFMRQHLNQLTIGHMLGLRAEALLCLYADRPTATRLDAYIDDRDAARAAFMAAHDEANFQSWSARIGSLEGALGVVTDTALAE